MQRNTISSLALRSGESLGVGLLAFASASITNRSAASPVSTGIDLIAIAITVFFCFLYHVNAHVMGCNSFHAMRRVPCFLNINARKWTVNLSLILLPRTSRTRFNALGES